jgi:hypothetical protein
LPRGLLHCGTCGGAMLPVTKPRSGGTYEVRGNGMRCGLTVPNPGTRT